MRDLSILRRAGGNALRTIADLLADETASATEAEEVTLVFADIEGWSSYVAEHGDDCALAVIDALDRAVARALADHRGARVVKRLGDGVMLVAADRGAGVAVAADLVLAFRDEAARIGIPLRLRTGVHRGTCRRQGDDYYGYHVNVAARVAETAAGGVALATAQALAGVDLAAHGISAHPAGWLRAKGVDGEVALFRVDRAVPVTSAG